MFHCFFFVMVDCIILLCLIVLFYHLWLYYFVMFDCIILLCLIVLSRLLSQNCQLKRLLGQTQHMVESDETDSGIIILLLIIKSWSGFVQNKSRYGSDRAYTSNSTSFIYVTSKLHNGNLNVVQCTFIWIRMRKISYFFLNKTNKWMFSI